MTTFTDDFNRADSTNLGSGWTEVSGDWSISGNRLSPGSAGGVILVRIATPLASNDNYAQVTIATTNTVSHGIWCRGDATLSSGYLLRNNGTSWDLFSVVSGTFTSIGTYAAPAAANDVVKIQAVGTAIKGIINGVTRISVTNSAVTTGGYAGIRSESTSTVSFDNFSAGDIVNGVSVTPVVEIETALTPTAAKSSAVPYAASIETAQNLPAGKNGVVNPVSEIETALPLMGSKHVSTDFATEIETALPLMGSKQVSTTFATEIEGAQQLAGSKTTIVSFGSELESALSLGGLKSVGPATVVEVEHALPLIGGKKTSVIPAVELETALQLTPNPGEEVPPVAQSILNSVKKMLNIGESDTSFDLDIIIHINSAFSTLHQIGIGPDEGFMIEDASATWQSFTTNRLLNSVKTYMYAQVRLDFDPPNTSFGIEAMERHIRELIWRINVVREGYAWQDPTLSSSS